MNRVILARHGQSLLTAAGLANGDPNVPSPLTEAGREEARRLGTHLADTMLFLCVTSEFDRAQETADIALEGRYVPRRVDAGFNDLAFGDFEGRVLDEYRAWAQTHPFWEQVPGGGESRVDLALRYCVTLSGLLEEDVETALVVGHGMPLTYLIDAAEGKLPQPLMRYVEYGTAHEMPASDLQRAVQVLEDWAGKQLAERPAG